MLAYTKGIVFPSKTNDDWHLKKAPKRQSHRPKRVFTLPGNEETYPTKREVKGKSTTQKYRLKTGWGYVLVSSQFGYSFHDFSIFFYGWKSGSLGIGAESCQEAHGL